MLTGREGELYDYIVVARDPDGDALNFNLTQSPGFLTINTLNDSAAILSGVPGRSDVGNHQIEITVDDGAFGYDTQNYQLSIQQSSSGGRFHSSIQVSHPQIGLVRITWQTREPSRDYIEYGLDVNYGASTLKDNALLSNHDQLLSGLVPLMLYHYQITSETESGQIYKSPDSTFTTQSTVDVKAYPIPYNVNEPNQYGGINFEFPASSESYSLQIYNIAGDLVFNVHDLSQSFVWNVANSAGKEVNAGLYIYTISRGNDEKIASGKLVIIR